MAKREKGNIEWKASATTSTFDLYYFDCEAQKQLKIYAIYRQEITVCIATSPRLGVFPRGSGKIS